MRGTSQVCPPGRSVPTSLLMRHASSIGSRLLSHIDVIEKEVGRVDSMR